MASPLEVKLIAKMDERERRESEMRRTLQNLADLNLPASRRLLAHLCMSWMALQEECNELARELADSIEQERGAA